VIGFWREYVDGSGVPVAVIEIVEVFIAPFNEVSEHFAYEEGEGDRSLAYWRQAHRNFSGASGSRIVVLTKKCRRSVNASGSCM
jgi:uncharacterized protein YhfF